MAVATIMLADCKSPKAGDTNRENAADSAAAIEERVDGNHGRVLVAYFSVPETDGVDAVSSASRVKVNGEMTSNTRYVASVIADATDGELFEIKTERTYSGSHKALIEAAQEEHDSDARPKLIFHIKSFDQYDTIFVGFPIWCFDMPMAIYSFFNEYDFSGKIIIPFTTHAGSGLEGSVNKIAKLERGSTVVEGHAVHRDKVSQSKQEVVDWLRNIGIAK